MGPRWQTRLDPDPESASEMTHLEVPWQFQGTVKRLRSGWWPKSRKSPPLPQNESSHSWAHEITQPIKTNHDTFHSRCIYPLWWPALCGVCFSLYLNKSTYSSFCLSLNSFCNETSRTWAFRPWNQVLWVLAGFEFQPLGVKSQAGFWLGSSPRHIIQVPICGKRFHSHLKSRTS